MAEISQVLYFDYIEARSKAKEAKAVADALALQIKLAAGEDEKLTVNGQEVGTYERINKFPVQKFIKDHPELAAQFMKIEASEVFDERLFKRSLPDVYASYQTRQLNVEG
jgi:hypothetical protein